MIRRTSSGLALYRMLMMSVLMKTDLPEPVEPAISRWGIFAISPTMILPPISLPTANEIFEEAFSKGSDSRSSRKRTEEAVLLGTSIPIAAFPGIGASIRISDAARLSWMSSCSDRILLTFTPISGVSSKRVTLGPQVTFVIFTFTPKVWNTS